MSWSRKYLSLFLAFVLTAALLPASAASAFAEEGPATAQASWANTIPDMLARGSYAEGEVLVAMLNQPSAPGRTRSASVSFLDGAQDIMGASVGTYEVATGETLPAQQSSALRSLGTAGEDEVVIKLIKQDMTTEELLYALAEDPRVLSAEPNYSLSFGDIDKEQAKQQAAEVAKALGDGDATEEVGTGAPEEDSSTTGNGVVSEGATAGDGVAGDGVATSTEAPLASPDTSALAGVTKGSFDPAKVTPVDATATTGDLTPYQWGYSNTTSAYPTGAPHLEGFDVNLAGWNDKTSAPNSNPDQVIAVLDTGLDYTHPDLENVMADMSAYSALGFGKYGINCARGDTQRPKNDPMDEQYHGTHVAGIIAAEWDERGVSGISKGAKVVGVKLGGVKSFSMVSAIEGFESLALAMDAGLNLVATNNSYASTGGSATILSIAVAKLGEKGAISVFASGNEDSNLDKSPSTVSGLMHNPYVVSVNASTILGERAPFSNYGVSSTDVFAPGMSIVSSLSHAANPYSITPQGNEALYESFKPGETPKVSFFNSANFDALGSAVGSLSEPMHFDDKGSWTIPSTQLSAQPDSANARSVVLKIPVEKNALEKARYIGFNVLLSKNKMEQGYLQVTPFMESEKAGLLRDDSQAVTNQVGDGWNRYVLDLKKLQTMKEGSGGLVYYEEAGSSYLLLGLDLRSNYWEAPDSSLYFDNIGVGYQTSRYLPMSGTSMASPAVAGAAAVHAKNLGAAYTNASGSERAKLLAATVKGSVGFTEKFDGLCTSGGQIDLGANVVKTSVINEAAVAGNSGSETLTLSGYFFGAATNDKTAVSVGGKPATVVSWSDNKIEVACPEGLGRGVHEVKVTNENGKTGRKTFLLNLANEQEGAVPLFEETIALPTELATTTRSTKMIGRGDKLYLMPEHALAEMGDSTFPSYGDMWRFDPASKSWEQLASMPERLQAMSVTLYEGKILVLGVTGTKNAQTKLFSFDPDTGAWTALSGIEAIGQGAAIVNSNGTLMLLGGPLEKGNIAVFDLASRSVTPVGSLQTPRVLGSPLFLSDTQVAAYGSEVFIWGGEWAEQGPVPGKLEHLTKTDEGYLSSDISVLLPKHAEGYGLDYGFAAVEEGLVAAGVKAALPGSASVASPVDTYLLDLAKPDVGFASKGLRSSYSFLEMVSAYGYGDKLYVAGTSLYEENQFVLRATAMKTLPQPGDIVSPVVPDSKPAAGSDASHKLATTGDSTASLAPVLVIGILAALVLIAVAYRRLKK